MSDNVRRSERFDAYLDQLADVIGHLDRHEPLRKYCAGLMLPARRKSVEPMAERISPGRVGAEHQSLLHFVGQAPWKDDAVLRVAREYAQPAMVEHGPIEAWIIDDTGIPKSGRHSVGVANQYCGVLGKNHNCQVSVSVSVATDETSLPVAHRPPPSTGCPPRPSKSPSRSLCARRSCAGGSSGTTRTSSRRGCVGKKRVPPDGAVSR